MTTQTIKDWRAELVKKWYIYDLEHKTPAGAEKDLIAFIEQIVREERERLIEIVGEVDEEFLDDIASKHYVGEWSLNTERQRILKALTDSVPVKE